MEIRPRKFSFKLTKYWFDNNKFKTFFWNANSLLFEQNEYIFCRLLSFYKKKVKDKTLLAEIDILFGQESWHSYNHKAFNEQLSLNYDISSIQNKAKRLAGRVLILKNSDKLSYAVCFEAMIVRVCKLLLKEKFTNTDPEIKNFWLWHTQEEIEHGYIARKLYRYFKFSRLLNIIHMLKLLILYIDFIVFSLKEFYLQDRRHAII